MDREYTENSRATSDSLTEISAWLANVKFKKKPFGGVDEADVWCKIDELNSLYEKALIKQQTQVKSASVCIDKGNK